MTDILDDIAAAVAARNTAQADADARIAALEQQITDASPSGEPMPTGDLPGWRYLMGEDFNTDCPLGSFPNAAYTGKIEVPPNTWFDTSRNNGRPAATQGQYDAARVISVSEGVLRKRIHTEGTRPKVAVIFPKIPGVPTGTGGWTYQTYGRYSLRARISAPMPGFKYAWLLWPSSNSNANDGEIDFPETGFDTLNTVGAFVHHAPSTPAPNQHGNSAIGCDLTKWHTFTTEWTPNLVKCFIDGTLVFQDTDRIPSTPMRWSIQTETNVGPTPPPVDVQGDVEIDWVAMWAKI